MPGAVNEEQVFAWQIGTAGFTVNYRILHWGGTGWDDEGTGTLVERSGGLYEVKFTPDAAGFWLALAYYIFETIRYDYGLVYFIGMGVEQDNYDLLTNVTYGLSALKTIIDGLNDISQNDILDDATPFSGASIAAILADVTGLNGDVMRGTDGAAVASVWTAALATALGNYTVVRANNLDELDFALQEAIAAIPTTMVGTDDAALASVLEDAMQKATTPAYNQDTDSLEALREAIDTKAPASEYDTQLDVNMSTRAPASEYDTEMGTGERASATALAAVQTDLDNPNQYKADVSGLAPSGEYDTELDATISSRAPASEYDTEMGTGERAAASVLEDVMQKATTPAYNQDTDSLEALREAIDTKAPANEYDTQLDVNVSTRAPSSEYDTELDATISSRAPASEYDTQLDANMSTRATPAQVQDEAEDALEGEDLDHFIQVSAGSEKPTVGSYLDKLMNKDGSQTFDPTTDSLEAISDAGGGGGLSPTGAGVQQCKAFSITNPLNNGITTVCTVGSQPVVITSIVLHADTAPHADMTTCAVEGGVNQVIEFLSAAIAVEANLNAADKQVWWEGAVRLAVGKIIYIDLQGVGANAADLTVTVTYHAEVNGGVLS